MNSLSSRNRFDSQKGEILETAYGEMQGSASYIAQLAHYHMVTNRLVLQKYKCFKRFAGDRSNLFAIMYAHIWEREKEFKRFQFFVPRLID